jgi:ABC-2 type transport system ATP-binding protein
VVAVDGISFTAEPGKIFGLLGPNGAGKTTTIGCISGLLPPSEGRIRLEGHDVVRDARMAKQILGVVPQELALYEELSATENLKFWAGAYGLRGAQTRDRVQEVLTDLGLSDRAREPVRQFSGGMKRRLNFGCAIVHRPKVLLLDEPSVGVDPQSRIRLRDLVREQANHGNTVLYTTHYMEEAEELCDSLGIVDHGKIIAQGTLAELRAMGAESDVLELRGSFHVTSCSAAIAKLERVELAEVDESSLRLTLQGATRRLSEIFAAVTAAGGEIRETTLTQPSLESLFIKLTGKRLRE